MWSWWFEGWRHRAGQAGVGAGEVCVRVCNLLQVVSYLDIETLYLPSMISKFNIFLKGVRAIVQNGISWIFFPRTIQTPTMSIGSRYMSP